MSLGTKVLSARVPFEVYIKVLEGSQKVGLSVSDYVIMKLQSENQTLQVGGKIEQIEKIVYIDNPETISELKEIKERYNKERRAKIQLEDRIKELEDIERIKGLDDLRRG